MSEDKSLGDEGGELKSLRDSIDNLDAALICVLAERFRCTKKISELKTRHDFPTFDPVRDAQQADRSRQLAAIARFDPDLAQKILAFVSNELI